MFAYRSEILFPALDFSLPVPRVLSKEKEFQAILPARNELHCSPFLAVSTQYPLSTAKMKVPVISRPFGTLGIFFAEVIMCSNGDDIPKHMDICWQMEGKSKLSRPELTIKASSPD